MRRRSDGLDVLGLGTLGARAGGELHPLVFLEATVTVSLNNGVVNEDVTCTVIWGDETIALVGVEPLHCTLSHFALSPTLNDVRSMYMARGLLRPPVVKSRTLESAAPAVRTSQAL